MPPASPSATVGFLFIHAAALNTPMKFKTFSEYVQWREGLLAPDKPRWVGMSRINTTGMTNQQRRNLMPKKPPKPKAFGPTIGKVGDVRAFTVKHQTSEGLWLNDKKALPGMSKLSPPPATPRQHRMASVSPRPIVPKVKPPKARIQTLPSPSPQSTPPHLPRRLGQES